MLCLVCPRRRVLALGMSHRLGGRNPPEGVITLILGTQGQGQLVSPTQQLPRRCQGWTAPHTHTHATATPEGEMGGWGLHGHGPRPAQGNERLSRSTRMGHPAIVFAATPRGGTQALGLL
jgi:hypothetical protein